MVTNNMKYPRIRGEYLKLFIRKPITVISAGVKKKNRESRFRFVSGKKGTGKEKITKKNLE